VNVRTETVDVIRTHPRAPETAEIRQDPRALQYSGTSRSGLYEWAAEYPGLFRKNGAATLVDFDILDTILDGLPAAEIGIAARKPSAV